MKITGLQVQAKNPERVSVFMDGKFYCGLNMSQVAELGIKKGDEYTEAEATALKKQSDLGKLYMRTLEWVLRRPRSHRELSDYLYKKKVDKDEQQIITGKVANYMSDETFARFWIEGRRGSKNKSARVIRGELSMKGVSKDIVEKLLDEHELTDQDTMQKVIEKKTRQTKYQDTQKLTEYLLRQGYSYDDIKSAVADLKF